ncbi:MAG: mechanosensitive ion channel family protein, partial [Acidovorax sp.]
DINLLYTTLEDHGATAEHVAWLQIPNALVFQRVVRRFQGVPGPVAPPAVPAPAAVATAAPSAEASVAISPPPASPPTAPAP